MEVPFTRCACEEAILMNSDEEKKEDCGCKRQEGQQRHQMHQPESALVHFLAIVFILLKG